MNSSDHRDNRIRFAIDESLSGLDSLPSLRYRVLQKAGGEAKVKRKLSVSLVFIIVIVLLAVTAFAVVTLTQTAQLMAQSEKDAGDFAYWPVETKVEVIRALNTQGYIPADDQVRRLASGGISAEEADGLADAIIEGFTHEDAKDVNFIVIMTSAWGDFDTWTTEQKAWYSQIMLDAEMAEIGNHTIYTLPTGGVGEAKALETARQAMLQVYETDEGTLDAYDVRVTFEIPEFVDDGQSYWAVAFEAPADMPQQGRLFHLRVIYVHPDTGALYRSVESMKASAAGIAQSDSDILTAVREFSAEAETKYGGFQNWPLELKAAYSEEIGPMVRAVMDSGDLTPLISGGGPQLNIMAQSACLYGLPDENAVSQENALALAEAALAGAFGLNAQIFGLYREIPAYYDVTVPQEPRWKFYFNPNSIPVEELAGGYEDPLNTLCYKAEINAYTGEAVKLEEFEFQPFSSDLEYILKRY